MKADPILRQVYKMKDLVAKEIGNDVGKLFELLHADAEKHPERIVRPRPKPAKRGSRRRANDKTAK